MTKSVKNCRPGGWGEKDSGTYSISPMLSIGYSYAGNHVPVLDLASWLLQVRWKREGASMKRKKFSFSIVDLMVVLAILMIIGATIAPHFAKTRGDVGSRKTFHQTRTGAPAR